MLASPFVESGRILCERGLHAHRFGDEPEILGAPAATTPIAVKVCKR